ncbi:MAG: metallophosphoesterase [Nocardioidaceae bacterium]
MAMRRHGVVGLMVGLLVASGTVTSSAAPSREPSAVARRTCTIAAAGDVAGGDDWQTGAARTAALIRSREPGRVIALGDLAYSAGTSRQFARYYTPTWGTFRGKTIAVPGNHEYQESPGAGLAAYFGARTRRNRAGHLCHGWRIVVLNPYTTSSRVNPAAVRRAARFLTAERRRHPRAKLIVAWHPPRFSSGDEHGDDARLAALWSAAVRARVRIVLNAHDHNYERFAPVGSGRTVEFVSGLGGHHVRGRGETSRNSRSFFTGTPAVLFLTLRPSGYSFAARTVTGRVVDHGSG